MNEDTRTLMVTIVCLAFNHESYIRNCLDGFVMQKTNFRFEAFVHDDASTDGTAAVIREYAEKYPDIIKPYYETENQYSKGLTSFSRIINEHIHGKYVAFCEGDDYWISSNKLQLQVDYLQNNPECGMCYTDFNILFQNKNIEWKSVFKNRPSTFPSQFESLDKWILSKKYVGPMTWLAKKDLYLSTPKLESLDGTFVQYAHYYAFSKIHCIKEETTAVYRIHDSSVTHGESYYLQYKRQRGLFEIQMKLADLYKEQLTNYNLLKNNIRDDYYRKLFLIIYNNDREEVTKAMEWMRGKMTYKQKIIFIITRTKLGRVLLFSSALSKIRRKPSDILE